MIELTVVIPTKGRHTLPRCLESMQPHWHGGYRAEVLVVADTASPLLSDVQAICRDYGVDYLEHDAGVHNWGYPQLQHGYERASGHYILNIGDDDVYVAGAFEAIRAAADEVGELVPLMFKAELHPSPNRGNSAPVVFWKEPIIREKNVTGQNFATPNDKQRMGFWWDDWRHAEATVRQHGGRVEWREELIARCY